MKTFSVLSIAAGLALAIVGFNGSTQVNEAEAWWGKPCATKKFKTELVEKACADGGQKAAKKAMKKFVKAVKKGEGGDPDLACDSCHKDLGGDFPLKDDAYKTFKKYEKFAK